MAKSKNPIWVWIIIAIVIIWIVIQLGSMITSGENSLKEDYEVSDFFCRDSMAFVEMKSLGNREEQVSDGLLYLC